MGRSTVSSAISSRERRPAPTSVRDDEGRALSRSEAKSCSGELRPRGSRDASAPLARSRGAPLDRAAELFLGQREARSETDSGSNLSVRARARAATRPVFSADTPPLAQTVRMMLGPAEVDLGFNLEVERQVLVARASAFLSPTMCPRPETRLSGSADTSFPSPLLPHARAVGVGTVALNAWYARQVAGTTYSYYDLSLALLGDCATTFAAASLTPLGFLSPALRCSAGHHARFELCGLELVVLWLVISAAALMGFSLVTSPNSSDVWLRSSWAPPSAAPAASSTATSTAASTTPASSTCSSSSCSS